MTVSTINVTSGPYAGNDIADTFNYTFLAIDKTNLSVYETDDTGTEVLLTLDVDYTVNTFGVDGGGTITRTAGPLPTGYTWYIVSNYVFTQLVAFTSQGAFFPDIHEEAFDKLTLLLQQLEFIQGRSPVMNPGYFGPLPINIENPIAGNVLRWSSGLDELVNYNLDLNPKMGDSYGGTLPITIDDPVAGYALRWSGDLTRLENYRLDTHPRLSDSYAGTLPIEIDDPIAGYALRWSGDLTRLENYKLDTHPRLSDSYAGSLPITIDDPIAGQVLRWSGDLTRLENYDIDTLVSSKAVASYDTLADAIADPSVNLVPACSLKERVAGTGGGAIWDVVDSGTVTPNGIYVIASTAVPAYTFVHRGPYTSASLGLTATPSVIDLRSVVPKDGDHASITVGGFSYDYVFDPLSSQSDNGATCLQAGAAPGRWQLVSTIVPNNFTVTVGAGGDFSTVGSALGYLSQYRSRDRFTATISLLTGFVMAEQVLIDTIDYGWVSVTSVDPTVTVTRSALTLDFYGRYPLFGAALSGVTPGINANFSFDASGTSTDRAFLYCVDGGKGVVGAARGCVNAPFGLVTKGVGSHINAEGSTVENSLDTNVFADMGSAIHIAGGNFSNAVSRNIHATQSSLVAADSVVATGAETNVLASSGGKVNVQNANLTGASNTGISAVDSGFVVGFDADISNSAEVGLRSKLHSVVNIKNANASNCGTAIEALSGGSVYAESIRAFDCGRGVECYGAMVDVNSGDLRTTATLGVLISGIACDIGARVLAHSCSVTTPLGVPGLRVFKGSSVDFTNGSCSLTGSSDPGGIEVSSGSVISAIASFSTPNVTPNTISANGIIYK